MIEHRWKKDTADEMRERWRREPFVSVDPGDNGALMMWDGPTRAIRMVYSWKATGSTFLDAARAVYEAGGPGGPVVMEDQFVGASRRSGIVTAKRAAYLLGAMATLSRGALHAVWVAPASWQCKYKLKGADSAARKLELVKIARDDGVGAHMRGLNDARCSGIADAWAIGNAWRRVVDGPG